MPVMQPHVFVLEHGAPMISDDPNRRWCICGLQAGNPVHNHEVVMQYFETQIKELKERLNEVPKDPTQKENVEVTVIITDSESTQIYSMEMSKFEMDQKYEEPVFLDAYTYSVANSGIKSITFSGEPVAKKDGTYYKHIQQKRD